VIIKALDRKLWRDLVGMWGQALAIALVLASGVATFVMSLSTMDSLRLTQERFYDQHRFAEVFASLKRAPRHLARRIAELPGVETVETRVLATLTVDIPDFPEPISGQLVSLPDDGQAQLNRLYVREGRLIAPGRDDEVIVSEAFATAHALRPGDLLRVIINGRRKTLTIVGTALSPEYIYQIQPGALFPDYKRYGIFWMGLNPLSAAYDMEGAFNNVVLTLRPHHSLADVLERLDHLLDPYGGLGAYGREHQLSHQYLSSELQQLENMAMLFPVIFLGVAAFLLKVVISRLLSLQREQIAALKAFGYHNRAVAWHYLKLALLIVLIGMVIGVAGGGWLGRGLASLYQDFFRFPYLQYRLEFGVVMAAGAISVAAATLGVWQAVRRAARLPPAQAMHPEPPARYRRSWIERWGAQRLLSPPARMILRRLERQPFQALLSSLGIGFACAILIVGSFQEDAIDYMMRVQFILSQRDDLTVTFVEPTAQRALYELQSLPGVAYGEAFRSVPVRLRLGHRSYRTSVQGLTPDSDLYRLLDTELRRIQLPSAGIVLTEYLGQELQARPGDMITIEVLEGERPVRRVAVASLVSQFVGLAAYMDLAALNRLLREGHTISGAMLAVDPADRSSLYATLKDTPRIAGVAIRQSAITNFYDTMGENILVFAFINTLLAGTIAFGVVYNNARIALSERSRELASLRVLGFTRGEVSYILLGELALLTLLGIPPGFLIGRALCAFLSSAMASELYRVPLIIEPGTYAFAAIVVILATILSSGLIGRKLARLDLVGVLKTRE
jgi:putative ABC transport system permease protein